jgi:3',5'-cyclic AMP phosphodiesterase CpdA
MKYDNCPLDRELGETSKVLRILAEEFERVEVITGNHDDRAKKYFAKFVPPEFFFLVNWDIMKIAADGLANVTFPSITVDGREMRFIWRSGDLVLGHPETSSKIPMRAVDTFANWLNQWERILNYGKVRVIGQGHTHQAGGPVMRGDGVVTFELGCMCRLPDYVFDAKLCYRPQTKAYGLFVQREGVTDLDESRLFFGPGK